MLSWTSQSVAGDPELFYVMGDTCCPHYLSDLGVPDFVVPGLIHRSFLSVHLTAFRLSLKVFVQGLGLTLVRECGGGVKMELISFA